MNFSTSVFNFTRLREFFAHLDLVLILALLPLYLFGLLTMNSYTGDNAFFDKQIIWVLLGLFSIPLASVLDYRFLRRTSIIVLLFAFEAFLLTLLFVVGSVFQGAQSWFDIGLFAVQPSEPAKLVLILILAKYFSRRHVEIANFRHVAVSGVYALTLFLLVLIQPDFGSAIILFLIWFGMVLLSGLSKRHIVLIALLGVSSFGFLWFYGFADYQKERIVSFLNPLADIRGAGYNAYQSMVAVGSGEIMGKGIGYGTQSKLLFLPEYETDFIFAAFAEEWGLIGALLVLLLFAVVLWRILSLARSMETNFERLFGIGLALLILAQMSIHIGMNIGLLPVTGVTLPFMSYGGSHILTEAIGIGILFGMRRRSPGLHRREITREFVGIG